MQRTEEQGIIISCDFCGTDWDPYDSNFTNPMTEGHQGSVLCLNCLRQALDNLQDAASPYECTLCIRTFDDGRPHWQHAHPTPSPGLNPQASICRACVQRAAKAFHKDKDINFTWEGAS